MMNFLPYAHHSINDTDRAAVVEALSQSIITRGPLVESFEKAVCERVGVRYAVAFSSGSSAQTAAFEAADVGPADQVVSSPNTFVASVAQAMRAGASLRLVDIDDFGNMDIGVLHGEVQDQRSRGKTIVVPVHFAGVAIDMAKLDDCIKARSTIVIEDAAHAFGSMYPDGSFVGNCRYSDMTMFSFHASKNITTGEGGMITTNDIVLASRLRRIRDSGIEREHLQYAQKPEPWYYEIAELGSNMHMTEMQAALGLSQLKRLDAFAQQKASLVAEYRHLLKSVPGLTLSPEETENRTHRHLFPVYIDFEALNQTRTSIMEKLASHGVLAQYHYVPLYRHPALSCAQKPIEFPAMERHLCAELSIPFFSSMTSIDVERVVVALRKALFWS